MGSTYLSAQYSIHTTLSCQTREPGFDGKAAFDGGKQGKEQENAPKEEIHEERLLRDKRLEMEALQSSLNQYRADPRQMLHRVQR